LVSFFEVITFFGVAAFFAWLEFLTLLNDLAAQFERSEFVASSPYSAWLRLFNRRQARHNLIGISDFFLVSFLFYATSCVANYFYHNRFYVGNLLVTLFYHNYLVIGAELLFFGAGIVTFAVPIEYVRSILRGDRRLQSKFTNVSGTLAFCYLTGLVLMLDWFSYFVIKFPYSDYVWFLAGCLTFYGLYRVIKKKRFSEIFFFAPILFMLGFVFLEVIWALVRWLLTLPLS
jgi:hypothetical protein